MDILFSNVTAVTMDDSMHVYTEAFVGVTNGKISYLSKKAPEEKPTKIIPADGCVLIPGLINCHTHLTDSILRGYADDLPLPEYLGEHILPRQDKLDERSAKAAALISIAESLRFGVTSVSDMGAFPEAAAEAAAQSGIKANIAAECKLFSEEFDLEQHEGFRQTEDLHEKWHDYDTGRIKVDCAIHAEYTSDYRLWDAIAEYAINNNLGVQLHLSETKQEQESCMDKYGLTPAQVLDCHHLFDTKAAAARCVQLTSEDKALLAKRGVSSVHCPVADGKFGVGSADVLELVRAGMNVCLGTESPAAVGRLDLFEVMKRASLTAKSCREDASALPAAACLMMATVCGARAQGRDTQCGQIKLGMDADLVLLDFSQPHLIPCHNVLSSLVYSATGHDVVLTMVRGNILYANGQYPTIDLASAVNELALYAVPHVFSDEAPAET